MKKRFLVYSAFFLVAVSAAFAGSQKKLSGASLSYKVAGDNSCHPQSNTVSSCGGTGGDCTVTVGGVATTYFANNDCTSILKLN